MTTFLKGAVKVFIARANDVSDTYAATDGPNASTLVKNACEIWDGDADRELYLIPGVTGISIGGYGKEFDTFQTLGDAFDHDIEIKEMGSGSCDFIMEYNRTAGSTGIPHEHLKALAYEFPNGWNTYTAGTGGNYATFDPTLDIAVTRAADERGYQIIIEQLTGDGSNSLYWCFSNCKIGCSISFANRQASRGTLTWDDARYVSFDEAASAGITSGSTPISTSAAKGF